MASLSTASELARDFNPEMWNPRSAVEIEQALASGELEPTPIFDGKRLRGQNKDIAVDICAMTVDGGALVYGVDEDEHGRITTSTPIELAGQRERIYQIVQTSIMEPPTIYVSEFPTEADPAHGYLVVRVPQSARAPHQVIVGNDMRYYGRGPTGNRLLTEAEIAYLYSRRERWEIDRDDHLTTVIGETPLSGERWGYMHAFARPNGFDSGFLRRQMQGDEMELRKALVAACHVVDDTVLYAPDLREVNGWGLFGADGIAVESAIGDNRLAIRMSIRHDGEARTFCCAAARYDSDGMMGIFENVIAGNLAAFLSATGAFYSLAGFMGRVDVGVAVTGIKGGVADLMHRQARTDRPYPRDQFRATDRVLAPDIAERPLEIAIDLLRAFLDGVVGFGYVPRL